MTDKDELARSILAAEINRRQDELIALEASFKRMGGSFDGDEHAPAPKQKLLTRPKAKKPRRKYAKRKAAPPLGNERHHASHHQWQVN